MSKQAADYFQRLNAMSQYNTESLARHSFEEQKQLKLPWYENTVSPNDLKISKIRANSVGLAIISQNFI